MGWLKCGPGSLIPEYSTRVSPDFHQYFKNSTVRIINTRWRKHVAHTVAVGWSTRTSSRLLYSSNCRSASAEQYGLSIQSGANMSCIYSRRRLCHQEQSTLLPTGHRSEFLFCLSVDSRPIYHQKAEILNFLMVYRSAMRRQTAGELQAHKGQYSDKQQRGRQCWRAHHC